MRDKNALLAKQQDILKKKKKGKENRSHVPPVSPEELARQEDRELENFISCLKNYANAEDVLVQDATVRS